MTRRVGLIVGLGFTVLCLFVAVPFLALRRTIKIPSTISDGILSDQLGAQKALTSSDMVTITNWLEHHRWGWRANVATPPAATASISLNGADREAGLVLLLWPGPKYPGWRQAVIAESPAGNPIGIQIFSTGELAPLSTIVGL